MWKSTIVMAGVLCVLALQSSATAQPPTQEDVQAKFSGWLGADAGSGGAKDFIAQNTDLIWIVSAKWDSGTLTFTAPDQLTWQVDPIDDRTFAPEDKAAAEAELKRMLDTFVDQSWQQLPGPPSQEDADNVKGKAQVELMVEGEGPEQKDPVQKTDKATLLPAQKTDAVQKSPCQRKCIQKKSPIQKPVEPAESAEPEASEAPPAPPAPPVAEEAETASSSQTPDTLMRTWVDNTGNYKTEAKLVLIGDDYVQLLKKNGQKKDVPTERLSDADLAYVQAKAAGGEIDQLASR